MLPETDDDAVRIMTIHGAKGLEFPITIVSGMTTRAQSRPAGVQLLFPPRPRRLRAARLGRACRPRSSSATQPIDEQMDFHEKLRLLYVACTRARDHLVVSVHRPAKEPGRRPHRVDPRRAACGRPPPTPPGWAPFAASDTDAAFAAATAVDTGRVAAAAVGRVARGPRRRPPARVRRRRVRSATALAREATEPAGTGATDPGLAKDARDLELPPWNKGRYGTAIGRAVHAVLQTVDLATGAGIDDTAAAQAAAEGVIGREDQVAARARVALDDPHGAGGGAYGFHREMYVAAPVDGTTLEGYVDLVYRRPDGLVVVDYKTDAWRDDADLDAKVARYRLQGASYAVALERATGSPVAECVFVFLGEHGAARARGQRSAGGDA